MMKEKNIFDESKDEQYQSQNRQNQRAFPRNFPPDRYNHPGDEYPSNRDRECTKQSRTTFD